MLCGVGGRPLGLLRGVFQAGRDFVWSGVELDTCGIVHFLGTDEGRDVWANPMTRGLVNVTLSSIQVKTASLSLDLSVWSSACSYAV